MHRLLFLRCKVGQKIGIKDLLGYVIFKADSIGGVRIPPFHIYESVFVPGRDATQNNFIHCARTYRLETTVGKLTVRGVLYAQQNDLTFVCAHVCLRTVLASVLPDADVSYAKINEITGVDHKSSKVGEGESGLGPDQMGSVLSHFGLFYTKIIHEPTKGLELPGDFQHDLYGAIESGQPALLGFEKSGTSEERHIIPVIGHTFNEDTWVAPATRGYFEGGLSYYPSENWLSTYVVHDDNFGPYFCLPRHFLQKDNFRIILSLKRHASESEAVDAEAIALAYLGALARASRSGNEWMERFKAFATSGLLVLRALLITKEEYLDHLRKAECWDGQTTDPGCVSAMEAELPDYFWMIEASAAELFSASRRKFGEIIIRSDLPTPKHLDWSLFLLARLPGEVLRLQSGRLDTQPCGTAGHVGLFEHPIRTEENDI